MYSRFANWYYYQPLPNLNFFQRDCIFRRTYVEVLFQKMPSHPERILALDIDGVILDATMSVDTQIMSIHHKEDLKKLLSLAQKKNVSVVLVTSRNIMEQGENDHIAIPRILFHLSHPNISSVFFADYKRKVDVLECLYRQCYARQFFTCRSVRHKICLVDDDIKNIEPASVQGFDTVHVTTLRIHTRLPVMIPERISESFLQWVQRLSQKLVMVYHCNHPNEINDELKIASLALREKGVTLLNQSVFLKRVNDEVSILKTLSEKLFSIGVLPYYLHALDKVSGSAHFELSRDEMIAVYSQLQQSLPGYLVPKLVYEKVGANSKTPFI